MIDKTFLLVLKWSLESLSNDDDNAKENVTWKKDLRYFKLLACSLFSTFERVQPLFRKYRSRETQITKINTEKNNMAAILRVLILFSSALTALNFDFSKASVINRYGHYSCTAHHTNRGW